MPRLTDSAGRCYSCGTRMAAVDYAPADGGVLGLCRICLPADAVAAPDGVYERPKILATEEV